MDNPLDATLRHIAGLPALLDLVSSLEQGDNLPNLGLPRAARLPVLAALHARMQVPIILVADRTDHALGLADELALWIPTAERYYFPEPNPLFYENSPWGDTTRRERLQALITLASMHIPVGALTGTGQPDSQGFTGLVPIIIAPARALMTRSLTPREFLEVTGPLRAGDQEMPESLFRSWVRRGYEPVNTVIAPGQCARRGGILDIWPPADQCPARLDFFGDEIESIRRFDPATQRTRPPAVEGDPIQLLVTPAREYLLLEDEFKIKTASREKSGDPHTPSVALEAEGAQVSEFHIPLLHPTPASILDYLPRQGLVVVDDWEAFQDTVNQLEEQALDLRKDYIEAGSLPEDFPLPYLTWAQLQESLANNRCLTFGPASTSEGAPLAQVFSPNPRFAGRLKPLISHLHQIHLQGEAVTVVSRQAARLEQLWKEQVVTRDSTPVPEFVQGSLAEGWALGLGDGSRFYLLTDGEIFGWRRPEVRQRPRAPRESPEASYADLEPGDWVVHVDHGIGRYTGLVQRALEGYAREYLCVEYAEGDQLFVPVHQADRLSRYIGPDGRPPSPSRLGGVEWRHTKERVHSAVEEVAKDLLELYARRETAKGHAFSLDTAWQHEVEAGFPYIETEDQKQVLAEVKRDMENERPMDRLICGDVGYGKTEVALRAAFKAVMDSKQVAVLVPTTVLAQQHYYTFRERLAPFPVEVEMLSRFRTTQEQRDILFRLVKGAVDIVIGTHRLLQSDVEFRDLGLLIIDEEQRFGVTHKETLKRMRTEVDVLTLTATPIPRTLYMSLTGVRDISMITTPPEERLPIVTHVGPFSPRLVRQAVLRELERGGQVFFVHNRVQTIHAMEKRLNRLVPEARLAIAHGQMVEKELAERMQQFTSGGIDLLLTTSIIESGLDIPNANTLIVDRADTFGLAQLYQLRGRVGRGAQRAYAYFLRHRNKAPTLEARQRLETIAENSQLGAGFSIAMRDLEIRGAGDILGSRQHGHIAAVGFHLYTRLLAEAVQHLRTGRTLPAGVEQLAREVQRPMVSVDLPLPSSIPVDYVPQQAMRLRLYRRLADLHELAEVDNMEEEFNDRFGSPPEPVYNLFYQLKVRILAERAGVVSVSSENGQIVLRFPALPEGVETRTFPRLDYLVRASKNALWISRKDAQDWQATLLLVLDRLNAKDSSPIEKRGKLNES